MFRLLFLCLLAAVGCSPKPGGSPPDAAPPADAAFTLKVVEEQPGQKVAVVRTQSSTTTFTAGATTQAKKAERRAEFVETVREAAPDAPRPTWVTREYTTALATDATGALRPLSYSGKAVEIRKSGPKTGYTFAADKKPLPTAEAAEFAKEFGRGGGPRLAALLPTTPVKVGDEWKPDAAVVDALAEALTGDVQATFDRERSSLTGKLARVYPKDGRQWGVVELRLRLEFVPGGPAAPAGSLTADGTLDAPIDGSVRAGTFRVVLKGELTGKDPKRGEIKLAVDGTQEQTVTPAN